MVASLYFSSTRARIAGYLASIGGGILIANGIGAAIRPYDSFAWTTGVDFAAILLPLLVALVLYAVLERKTRARQQIVAA